uniref:(northern house mosquito) hypothetical protein n=1 Tax=Culex pipiens TaxID=7175 RepID=A0A8D8HAH9_CULPI
MARFSFSPHVSNPLRRRKLRIPEAGRRLVQLGLATPATIARQLGPNLVRRQPSQLQNAGVLGALGAASFRWWRRFRHQRPDPSKGVELSQGGTAEFRWFTDRWRSHRIQDGFTRGLLAPLFLPDGFHEEIVPGRLGLLDRDDVVL